MWEEQASVSTTRIDLGGKGGERRRRFRLIRVDVSVGKRVCAILPNLTDIGPFLLVRPRKADSGLRATEISPGVKLIGVKRL